MDRKAQICKDFQIETTTKIIYFYRRRNTFKESRNDIVIETLRKDGHLYSTHLIVTLKLIIINDCQVHQMSNKPVLNAWAEKKLRTEVEALSQI